MQGNTFGDPIDKPCFYVNTTYWNKIYEIIMSPKYLYTAEPRSTVILCLKIHLSAQQLRFFTSQTMNLNSLFPCIHTNIYRIINISRVERKTGVSQVVVFPQT